MTAWVRLIGISGVILLYRYSLALSTPRRDWWFVVEYSHRARRALQRGYAMVRVWMISLVKYVPSKRIERAWVALRDNVRAGRYGAAGT